MLCARNSYSGLVLVHTFLATRGCVPKKFSSLSLSVVRNYAYNMSCYVKVNGQFKVKDLRPISHTIAEDTLSILHFSCYYDT